MVVESLLRGTIFFIELEKRLKEALSCSYKKIVAIKSLKRQLD
jgi:hypothetical protein